VVIGQHIDERRFANVGTADERKFGLVVLKAFLMIGIAGNKSGLRNLHALSEILSLSRNRTAREAG
jgi:hypothetical protein